MEKGNLLDPETLLEEHGNYLYRFALMRIKDVSLAEDMVQETMLAAISTQNGFSAGPATIRTWLAAIMKNKIIDHFRRQGREITVTDLLDNPGEEGGVDEFFNKAGRWADMPNVYPNPDAALENKQFWKIFEHCLSRLKPHQAEVFMAKEVHGMSNEEVCERHSLSASNVWVLVHRARVSLGKCLELNWAK